MLIKTIADKILFSWKKNKIIDPVLSTIYQYGLELMISSMISIALVILLGTILVTFEEAIAFLTTFIPIRLYCGGYHANTYFKCNLSIVITFFLSSFCASAFSLTIYTITTVALFSFLTFLFLSPVENKYKPLDFKQKKKCKIISLALLVLILFICYILYFMNIHYFRIVLFTIVAITVLMLIGLINNSIERRKKNEEDFRGAR